ncbi:rhomboid family intramembrane serine protease [bacterium]|nr:rhomboid family intramembrane serine protease [bacterium]
MNRTFRETDYLLSEHMPIVTRRIFWAIIAAFFIISFAQLIPVGAWLADHLVYLKASQAIFQGNVWQFLLYPFAPSDGGMMASVINTAFTLLMLFFFGRMVEEQMGSRRFLWFLTIVAVLTGVVHCAVSAAVGAAAAPLAGFLPLTLAMLLAIVLWYPDAQVRFMFFIPMPMKFLGFLTAALILLGVLGSVSSYGWPVGFALSLHAIVAPLIAFWLLKRRGVLDFFEDIWWHNPLRRGPKPVRRMSMGHPGRHSDPDDRYNDPHWKLDQ